MKISLKILAIAWVLGTINSFAIASEVKVGDKIFAFLPSGIRQGTLEAITKFDSSRYAEIQMDGDTFTAPLKSLSLSVSELGGLRVGSKVANTVTGKALTISGIAANGWVMTEEVDEALPLRIFDLSTK